MATVEGVKVLADMAPGQKIGQIRVLRAFTGFRIREAKDIVEAVNTPPVCPITAAVQAAIRGTR